MKGVYNIKKILIVIILLGLYKNIALFLSFENANFYNNNLCIKGEIQTLPEKKEYVNKYILKIIEENSKMNNKKIIIYTKQEINLKPGDIVKLEGIIEKPEGQRNFKGFNYRRYLRTNKIYGIMQVQKIEYIKSKKDLIYIIGKIKNEVYICSRMIYSEEYSSFINKILFASENELNENVQNNFRDSGISHIIAISGLHISYIVLFSNLIFKSILKNSKIKNICLSIILVFFIIFTDFTPSCMRACIMTIILLMAKNNYRKNNIYISICFTFFLIIFFNIYSIFDIGMWLSFFGTLGIVVFYKILKEFMILKSNRLFCEIQNIIIVSLSAQILIFPIVLYTFNTISLTFFISNLLISQIIGPIVIGGYISIFISMILKKVGSIIAKIIEVLIFILYKIAEICSKIPFSKFYVSGNYEIFLIFYYSIIFGSIFYFAKNKMKILKKIVILKSMTGNDIKRMLNVNKKKFQKIIAVFLIIIIIPNTITYISKKEIELYFVDVGQGDCTIIKTKSKNIIIDGGEGNSDKYDYGKNVVLSHLLKLGISKIDYMIFSHFDSDHAGGLIYVLENLKVGKIIFGIQNENSDSLENVIKIAKEKRIEIIILKAGDMIKVDKNCYIDVIWPNSEKIMNENILNNNSLVFKFIYKDFSILFTGDIEEKAEKEIIELNKSKLKSTVLKVAHHGSKSSSTSNFLNEVTPQIALIGVGENNKFGHPSERVIQRLKENGVNIYRTDQDGEISIIVNRKGKIIKVNNCIK